MKLEQNHQRNQRIYSFAAYKCMPFRPYFIESGNRKKKICDFAFQNSHRRIFKNDFRLCLSAFLYKIIFSLGGKVEFRYEKFTKHSHFVW